jgi:hypothetical protein
MHHHPIAWTYPNQLKSKPPMCTPNPPTIGHPVAYKDATSHLHRDGPTARNTAEIEYANTLAAPNAPRAPHDSASVTGEEDDAPSRAATRVRVTNSSVPLMGVANGARLLDAKSPRWEDLICAHPTGEEGVVPLMDVKNLRNPRRNFV